MSAKLRLLPQISGAALAACLTGTLCGAAAAQQPVSGPSVRGAMRPPALPAGVVIDTEHGEELKTRWGYRDGAAASKTPRTSWPDVQPTPDELPGLRAALAACGGVETANCHPIAFALATGLLGGGLSAKDVAIPIGAGESEEGAALMVELAARGSLDGACGAGLCHVDGRGVAPDATHAASLFAQAAEGGLAQAQHELACLLYRGDGVPEDEPAAVAWFGRAAVQGHAAAMYMLGDCLVDGVGTEADPALGLLWLAAAAEEGHRGARSRVLAVLLPTADDKVDGGVFTDASRQTLVSSLRPAKH